MTDKNQKNYICPMHPDVQQAKPGMCPECGMNLVLSNSSKSNKADHKENSTNKHRNHKTNVFKVKFWVSLILSVPVVLYSDITMTLVNWSAPYFPGHEYITLVLGSVVFFYGGWIFLTSAYREIRAKQPGMMTLISLAIVTAYIYSLYIVIFNAAGRDLLWEVSTLIVVMLLGHWLEMRAVSGVQGALKELTKLLPDKAEVVRNGKTEVVSLSEIKAGDIVLIKPGEKIPADGEIIEGSSDINEALITGESTPVRKYQGMEVVGGTSNGDGSLKVKVTKTGENTFLSSIERLVQEAQASKSKLQLLSDRAAFYLTIIAVIAGIITLIAWLIYGDTTFAIERLVAVLVITCPHALGLAIPLVATISTTKAANNGFIIKKRLALESARKVNVVLFDKTGTLTKGEFGIYEIIPAGNYSQNEVLQLATSVNSQSEHPIATAMVKHAQSENLKLRNIQKFQRLAGKGVKAEIDGQTVLVGSVQLAQEVGIAYDKFESQIEEFSNQGKTAIFVIKENELIGVIALADVIRKESRQAVENLRNMGIKSVMITGDNEKVAKWVSAELQLDEYFAGVLPEEKSTKVKLLQKRGQKVAMVGDGINDAPALTQADLGVAIGAGTNVAIESAGIILVKNDPRDIVKIINLSRLTYKKMIQNLWWAAGYNIFAIPLAAGALAAWGIWLQPAVAAILMSVSTVIVAFNAWLLKLKKVG